MKYIKTHEELITTPKVGDFVICEISSQGIPENVKTFIRDNIGQIIKMTNGTYIVEYNNIPEEIKYYFTKTEDNGYLKWKNYNYSGYSLDDIDEKEIKLAAIKAGILVFHINCYQFYQKEIIYFSPNKEDVELYINTDKYNI